MTQRSQRMPASEFLVGASFFASGAAALIYQVLWQRLLSAVFGVDLEATTIVVATVMLGIGIGAIAGGVIADRFPHRLLMLFCLFEIAIGLFGLVSLDLIAGLDDVFISYGRGLTIGASFGLLLVPTSLMGATLPMLVARGVRRDRAVGDSFGGLYFLNTLGGAIGVLAAGFLLLYWFDFDAVIRICAALNLLSSLFATAAARIST